MYSLLNNNFSYILDKTVVIESGLYSEGNWFGDVSFGIGEILAILQQDGNSPLTKRLQKILAIFGDNEKQFSWERKEIIHLDQCNQIDLSHSKDISFQKT